MKILFTADLHIKLNVAKIPNQWQINRFTMLGDQLLDIISKEHIDLLIFGGDIFDKKPSIEEIDVFLDKILNRIRIPVILYDGNHEATKKGQTFLPCLASMSGLNVQITDTIYHGELFDIIPYTNLKTFDPEKTCKSEILFTHVRGSIPPHVSPEIDLDKLNCWKTVFAGDLHAHSNSQRNIVYPGSPISTSFHRNEITTGVIVIDMLESNWKWVELNIPQLLRLKVSSEEDMVPQDFNHVIYELEGTVDTLAKVKNTELLDKKLVVKNTKSTLDISDSNIVDTAVIYWYEVLGLDKPVIDSLASELTESISYDNT